MNSQDNNPIFQQWLNDYLNRLVQVLRGCPAGETLAPQQSGNPSGATPEVTQE